MSVHDSSINYHNLIQDLAEMYPLNVAEVIIVELVANSLDAKATRIRIDYDPRRKHLTVTDNGQGMNRSQFDEYHDFAAGLKARGSGIGFAGLGAKISFNIADAVITETVSHSFSAGSKWYLRSKKKLVWEDIHPTHLCGNGTRVEVRFRPDTKPPYSRTQDVTAILKRHYFPLIESEFLDLYARMNRYSASLRFVVNGQTIEPRRVLTEFSLTNTREFILRKGRKRYAYGILGLAHEEYPLAPDVCGVLLCTYGKVIKPDLFNQFPGSYGPRIFGLVEVPEFVKFLTTAKTDFIRKSNRKQFERLYDPIRQEFKTWLAEVGVQPVETVSADEATRLQRELNKLLEDVPELAEFFGSPTREGVLHPRNDGPVAAEAQEGMQTTFPLGEGAGRQGDGPIDVGEEPGEALVASEEGKKPAKPISRVARHGPRITFVEAPDGVDLAWVEGHSVVINRAHPSYSKARSAPLAQRIHSLFAIGSAIQKIVGSDADGADPMFIDRMMAAWGKR